MKLTKYKHACFTVEKEGQLIVVDPGNLSDDFRVPSGVIAVIITHQHADHFDHSQLTAITDKNPEAVVLAHPLVIDQIEGLPTKAVEPGDELSMGSFTLKFYGGEHALIHRSIPIVASLGVMIDGTVYYPGDSLFAPDVSVDVLALPAAAPWMKIAEAIDFLLVVKPRLTFPTHDAILSASGQKISDTLLEAAASSQGIIYTRLTEPLDI